MSKVSQEYFDLMLYWKEGAIVGYLRNDAGRIQRAIQVLKLRHTELSRIPVAWRDDMDHAAMEDCTELGIFLERCLKRLPTLVTH